MLGILSVAVEASDEIPPNNVDERRPEPCGNGGGCSLARVFFSGAGLGSFIDGDSVEIVANFGDSRAGGGESRLITVDDGSGCRGAGSGLGSNVLDWTSGRYWIGAPVLQGSVGFIILEIAGDALGRKGDCGCDCIL